MKKFFLLLIAFTLSIASYAQSERYMTAMTKLVAQLDTTRKPADLQKLANQFELIANKEHNQWLPYYYAAFCNANLVYQSDKKMIDDLCDKAEAQINKADSLQPNNSEIYVVKARVNSARIMVNPMSRGAKYGKISGEWLEKAKAIDANNPRVYLTQATALFYTPKMFGGGKDKAKPILETAAQKFEIFKPESALHPNWGKVDCNFMLSQCKE
jgi:hypothetical protein